MKHTRFHMPGRVSMASCGCFLLAMVVISSTARAQLGVRPANWGQDGGWIEERVFLGSGVTSRTSPIFSLSGGGIAGDFFSVQDRLAAARVWDGAAPQGLPAGYELWDAQVSLELTTMLRLWGTDNWRSGQDQPPRPGEIEAAVWLTDAEGNRRIKLFDQSLTSPRIGDARNGSWGAATRSERAAVVDLPIRAINASGSLEVNGRYDLRFDATHFDGNALGLGVAGSVTITDAAEVKLIYGPSNPPDHLIITTHGWQRGQSAPAEPSGRLNAVANAARARLGSSVEAGEVGVVDWGWAGAYTPTLEYDDAYQNSFAAGANLARFVENYIELGDAVRQRATPGAEPYAPSLHLVGHSLGTIVTAQAVRELHSRGRSVDLVTLLDTPLQTSRNDAENLFPGNEARLKRRMASYNDALFFYRAMPAGSVKHVENFYATGSDLIPPFSFGQPIAGAWPVQDGSRSGQGFNVDHTEIHEDIYAGIVADNDDIRLNFQTFALPEWRTPYLDNLYDDEPTWSPAEQESDFLAFLEGQGIFDLVWLNDEIGIWGQSETIDDWNVAAGQADSLVEGGARLVAESPAELTAELVSDDVFFVEFDYEIDDNRAELSVWFDDVQLWTSRSSVLSFTQGSAVTSGTALVPTGGIDGTGQLRFVFESDIPGSSAELSSLTLSRLVETATMALLGDFNASGQVEQGDLNLVLQAWGEVRGAWANATAFATPLVDQEELNAVLSNWGSSSAPSFASNPSVVPEPGAGLGLVMLGWLGWWRRIDRRALARN